MDLVGNDSSTEENLEIAVTMIDGEKMFGTDFCGGAQKVLAVQIILVLVSVSWDLATAVAALVSLASVLGVLNNYRFVLDLTLQIGSPKETLDLLGGIN